VFEGWEDDLQAPCIAVDLRPVVGPRTAMAHYAAEIASYAADFSEPPVIVGWSLGGLAAFMATRLVRFAAVVALEPSAPAEVVGKKPDWPLREGLYDAETYGIRYDAPAPAGLSEVEWLTVVAQCYGATESRYARHERTRGIYVAPIEAPLLVVHGDVESYAEERGPRVAQALGGESLLIPGASHWALVVGEQFRKAVRGEIARWVERRLG
jgi:pimeloyl-ACP methyl ester carboxylesterase